MIEFDTAICKRYGNWHAQSTMMINDTNRELKIVTMKHHDGVVRTRASVHRLVGTERRFRVGFGINGDFSAPMMAMRYQRVTETTVSTQHATCLAQAESVLFQVRDHYAKQEAAAEPVEATVDGDAEVTA